MAALLKTTNRNTHAKGDKCLVVSAAQTASVRPTVTAWIDYKHVEQPTETCEAATGVHQRGGKRDEDGRRKNGWCQPYEAAHGCAH